MKVFGETIPTRASYVIFGFLFFIIVALGYLYIFDFYKDPKWTTIIAGLFTGFVIALFQAFLSSLEFKVFDEYYALKIKKILPDRNNPVYYGDLISKARNEIKIQGVTAYRLLDDFADESQNVSESKKVLLRALDRKVKVSILIADTAFLSLKNQRKAKEAEPILKDLSIRYPNTFEYRYFKFTPAHSIVIIDDEYIVGPVFPDVESKDTPAIHLKRDSQLAKYYESYFNAEWSKAL